MTDNPQNPLDYQSRRPNYAAGGVGKPGQFALGCAGSLALFVVSAVLFFITLGVFGFNGGASVWLLLLLFMASDVLVMVFFGLRAKNRWRWSAFVPGLILGFLLPLLAVGLCFAVVLGSI